MLAYPFFLFGELIAPIIEGLGILGVVVGYFLGAIDGEFIALFFLAAWGVNILMNLVAILVEQLTYKRYQGLDDIGRMVYYAFVENVGFRQVTVYWRLKGFWQWFRGRHHWGEMSRRGFTPAP